MLASAYANFGMQTWAYERQAYSALVICSFGYMLTWAYTDFGICWFGSFCCAATSPAACFLAVKDVACSVICSARLATLSLSRVALSSFQETNLLNLPFDFALREMLVISNTLDGKPINFAVKRALTQGANKKKRVTTGRSSALMSLW